LFFERARRRVPVGAMLLGVAAAAALQGQVTVLTHALVIDGRGGPPAADTTIVMAGQKIQEMGTASRVRTPAGAQVIDCAGKTIVPGIINLHSHIGEDTAFKIRQFALYGVTSTVGLGGDGDEVLKIRDAQRRGDIKGSRIYTVQQRFESAKDARTPEEGRARVDELYRKGADAIKIVVDTRGGTLPKLQPEVSAAIIDQSHKHHLKAFAHLGEYDDAMFLMEHGLDIMAHNVRDRDIDDVFLKTMKKMNVTVTATLAGSQSFYIYADSPAWLDDPFFLKWAPPDRVKLAKTEYKATQQRSPGAANNRAGFEVAARNLKKMSDAGARVGMGNDDGNNPTRFEGFWEHLEMELMVKNAGMTPMQVIVAYSKTNAEALGIDGQYGSLAKGKVADLIVLDKNPADDIMNLRAINAVYIGGRKFN
jgi:imidazolonepropionase-like amidohydrolase